MTRTNSWTPEEEAWLREVYPDHGNAEIAAMHAERFPDRPRRTDKSINSRAKVYGLHKADGFVRKPPRFWTPERVEWFRAYVPGHTESEISAEHERLFGAPLSEGQIGNAKTKLGVRSGTHGARFEKRMERQRRCEDCIAEAPTMSVDEQRWRRGTMPRTEGAR